MPMKQFEMKGDRPRLGSRLRLLVMGLPLVTLVLLVTQVGWHSPLQAWTEIWRQPLAKPYRYQFPETLPRGNPLGRLEQEIAFHQQQLQIKGGALEQAALATSYLRMARTSGIESWYLLAEIQAQQSLQRLPFNNAEALTVLARLAEARHDFPMALKLAEQIPNPEEAIALKVTSNLALGKLTEARYAADKLVSFSFSPSAFTLQALVCLAQGREEEGLQSFHYALETEDAGELSQSARVRTLLGRYYYGRGQLQQAEGLYREALRIWPDYPPALINAAQLAIRLGQYNLAKSYYARLGDRPSLYRPLQLRGQAQIASLQGHLDRAESLWKESETALRSRLADPITAFAHRRDLARLLLERGHPQDHSEALTLLELEVQRRQDPETLSLYAQALSLSGQEQVAHQVLQQTIAQGTRSVSLLDQAVQLETHLGKLDQAQQYQQQLQTLDPTFSTNDEEEKNRARKAFGLGLGLSFY
jgi:tetratricopeptide (TPR) repeat protein